jgi:hypothetical protein
MKCIDCDHCVQGDKPYCFVWQLDLDRAYMHRDLPCQSAKPTEGAK